VKPKVKHYNLLSDDEAIYDFQYRAEVAVTTTAKILATKRDYLRKPIQQNNEGQHKMNCRPHTT
jgi:hypothetical protein